GEIFTCQHPRFLAARKGRTVHLYCACGVFCSGIRNVSWYIGDEAGAVMRPIVKSGTGVLGEIYVSNTSTTLTLQKIDRAHNGLYYCKFHTASGEHNPRCGTEIMVLGCGTANSARAKNTMKDAILMVQIILIALFIIVPAMLLREM
ncbi:hypothetical protein FKM82_020910, partial [Ascaphus truei]